MVGRLYITTSKSSDRVHACGRSSVHYDFAIFNSIKDRVHACGTSSEFYDLAIPFLKPFGIMATSRLGRDVEGIDGITSSLTQTILAEDTTRPAIEPPTGKAEMDAITNRLSEAVLKEDRIEGEADEEEDEDSLFLPEGPVSEEVRQRQAAEAAAEATAAKQREEGEQTSTALSTACDMWSIENNEEAKAKREVQRIQDRLQQEEDNRVQVLEAARARRRADANHAAAWKKWVEDKAKAMLIEANRAAQQAEDEEAGQKLAQADALAIQNALQREVMERE